MLAFLALLTWTASQGFFPGTEAGRASITFGFLLIAAFLMGDIVVPLGLPRISGYLIAGLLFGPGMLGIADRESLESLKVIDSLALTFIALSAGGELQLSELRANKRIIAWSLLCQMVIIFLGSTLLLLILSPLFAFTRQMAPRELFVVAACLGAIATARSPASAIALIKELRAHGPFTEVALGLTVAIDLLAIVLFALVISIGETVLSSAGLQASYLAGLMLELGSSLVIGVALGFALAAWLRRVHSHRLITVFLLAVLVSEVSRFGGHWLDEHFGIAFHLEPMLICIATGFVVRNFSSQGMRFVGVLEQGGLMVFTLFFAIAGAMLDLDILRSTWHLALLLVILRFATVQFGAWLGATIAKAGPVYRKHLGNTFITQAGVSLGLAKAVEARFPEWGGAVATLAIASISINQLIGPILFKGALGAAGEVGGAENK